MYRHMANNFENKNAYRILVGKYKAKIPRGWENQNKFSVIKIGCKGVEWIQLVEDEGCFADGNN